MPVNLKACNGDFTQLSDLQLQSITEKCLNKVSLKERGAILLLQTERWKKSMGNQTSATASQPGNSKMTPQATLIGDDMDEKAQAFMQDPNNMGMLKCISMLLDDKIKKYAASNTEKINEVEKKLTKKIDDIAATQKKQVKDEAVALHHS